MDHGDILYTRGATSNKVALVEKYTCTPCRRVYIQSAADAVTDNNLDSLRSCARELDSRHGLVRLSTERDRSPSHDRPFGLVLSCVPPGTASKAVLVVSSETMHEDSCRKLRKSMGLTQAQMAGLIRVPLVTVRAWEAGPLEIKSKKLIRRKRGGRLS
jgi:DNA-binding XRE family transcriptional regulator